MTSGLQALERERKFYFALVVFLITTLMRAFDQLTDATYGEIVIYTVGLFMLGNGAEHAAKAWQARADKITEPPK